MLRRMAWGLGSQGFNSIGNMLLAFWVARESATTDFGAWSLGYAAFMVALQMARAVAATPLLLEVDADRRHWHSGAASGLGVLIASVASIVLLISGTALPSLRAELWAFSAVIPVAVAQDMLRHVAFSRSRPDLAVLADATWLCAQIALSVIALSADAISSPTVALTLAWGAAALVSAVVAAAALRVGVTLTRALAYHRRTGHLSRALAGDAALGAVGSQSLPMVVAAVAGLAATGALRGGLTLMGPLNIVITGLTPVATMEAKKRLAMAGGVQRFVVGWCAALLVLGAAYGALLLVLPDSVGADALGATWQPAQLLLLPLIIEGLMRGPWSVVPIILRAQLRVHTALKLKMVTTLFLLSFPTAGALMSGAIGAAWGVMISSVASSVASLIVLRAGGPAAPRA